MAKTYPQGMSYQDTRGFIPLHWACVALSSRSTDNMMEICKFLATECPESVRVVQRYDCLPIHFIATYSNRSRVQSALTTLLREYPESIDISAKTSRFDIHPRSIPFIQRVGSLLQDERTLKDELSFLSEASAAWHEATLLSGNNLHLHLSVSNVFRKWATSRAQTFSHQLTRIPELILEIGRECEGEDVEQDHENDESLSDVDFDMLSIHVIAATAATTTTIVDSNTATTCNE